MKLIESPLFVLEQTDAMKFAHRKLLTNYYFNKENTEYWVGKGLFYYEKIGDTLFFYKKEYDFYHLFYISPSSEDLGKGLTQLSSRSDIIVADVLTKQKEISPILNAFLANKFFQYRSLVRMSRVKGVDIQNAVFHEHVRFASKGDEERIHNILDNNFDRYAEQIPNIDELGREIEIKNIIMVERDGVIAGLLHLNLSGLTSHLRRWFVNPDYRDQHVGSMLMRSYFSLSYQASRFILWVIIANDNAIKRYMHYGYIEDDLTDIILANKRHMHYGK